MARVWMLKANKLDGDGRGQCLVLGEAETYESVAVGASSTQSGVIATKYVELTADVDCQVAFGSDPTAVKTAGSETGVRMAAGQTKTYGVREPGVTKIAVIESA